MLEGFSDEGRLVVQIARDEASRLEHGYIGPEHLLLGLIHPQGSIANDTLTQFRLTEQAVRAQIARLWGSETGLVPRVSRFRSPHGQKKRSRWGFGKC